MGILDGDAMNILDEIADSTQGIEGQRLSTKGIVPCCINITYGHPILPVAWDFGRELLGAECLLDTRWYWKEVPRWPYDRMLIYGPYLAETQQRNAVFIISDEPGPEHFAAIHVARRDGPWVRVTKIERAIDGALSFSSGADINAELPMETKQELAVNLMTFVEGAYGMFSMKHFDKSESAPGRKLQAKREKAGKPPLPDQYLTIRLNARVAKAYQGGTHASPRPHWRRGHVRTLESGKRVAVQPHMVNGVAPMPKGITIE